MTQKEHIGAQGLDRSAGADDRQHEPEVAPHPAGAAEPRSRSWMPSVRTGAAVGLALGAVSAVQLVGVAPASADATTCTGAGGIFDQDCTSIYGDQMWIDDAEMRLWRWGELLGRPVPRQVCQYNAHFFGVQGDLQPYDVHGAHQAGCAWSPVWIDSPTINRHFKVNTYFCGEAVENNAHSARYVCWMMRN